MPVGTVIAWPVSSDPSGIWEGHWLECNGQTVDSSQYPKLAALMNNVPDYRGMFLRGLGSQNFSQNNGAAIGTTNTTYTSSELGQIQGDGLRNIYGDLGTPQFASNDISGSNFNTLLYGHSKNAFYSNTSIGTQSSYPVGYQDYCPSGGYWSSDALGWGWYDALTKYEYTPHISYGDAGGIRYVSDISFDVKEIHPSVWVGQPIFPIKFASSAILPTANEIRPINMAVRYMIKAK